MRQTSVAFKIGVILALDLILQIVGYFATLSFGDQASATDVKMLASKFNYIVLYFIFISLVVPIFEEFVFRWMPYNFLVKKLYRDSKQAYVLIGLMQAALFSYFHIKPELISLVLPFIIGCCSWLIMKYFGFLYSIMFHVLHNSLASLFILYALKLYINKPT
jgi:membrane protease YdiL (CAAX protease family)